MRRHLGAVAAAALLSLLAGGPAAAQVRAATLDSSLNEQVIAIPKKLLFGSIDLETTIFRPPGDGPFPLVVINHGKADGNPQFQSRARYSVAAREFVRRGYVVALPMRQGFSRSGGNYIAGGCNLVGNGDAQAEDVKAALDHLVAQPYVDASAIAVLGQSHGGWTTLAFGALGYPGVRALVNFAGGLRQTQCAAWQSNLIRAAGDLGARNRLPTLWFYGENDSYFEQFVYRGMHEAYTRAGGQARLVEFGIWPHGDAHAMFTSRAGVAIWLPEVERLFRAAGLPFDPAPPPLNPS